MPPRSDALLLAYYGDDFTGSTDVLEALSKAGLRTVLFLAPPTPEQMSRFPGLRAMGIAGGSRTMSPEDMERALPPAFEALRASGASIIHYKMCSTLDSSPRIGSIGRAIEIGRRVFGNRPTPMVVGAPALGRYVAFGNLFARSGLDTEPFRLDRHPTMSRHPITPMSEADIRRILADQTALPVELVDALTLENPPVAWRVAAGSGPAPIVLFDTMREAHLPVIGEAIEAIAAEGPLFVVGSSGMEYALTAHWAGGASPESRKTAGVADARTFAAGEPWCLPTPGPVKQLVAVSGSCSPVTDRQIAHAIRHPGIVDIPLACEATARFEPTRSAIDGAVRLIAGGNSVILHTSRGPEDPRRRVGAAVDTETSHRLGDLLAHVLEELLRRTGLRRAVVCGGDTSMHVSRALGIEALEYLGPMAPGGPLCRVHANGRIADGCEILFKGGQVGRDRLFLDVLEGKPIDRPPPPPMESVRSNAMKCQP
jgi:uncharacterized protein YgbK (DUF1537 family)